MMNFKGNNKRRGTTFAGVKTFVKRRQPDGSNRNSNPTTVSVHGSDLLCI